jgi:polyisoprenoid-binding protein YceI
VYFISEAALEKIEARSTQLKGVFLPDEKAFSFAIPMNSFEGFNSPLQREHFNENYLETDRYKEAKFSGKIIDQTDLSQDGEYTLRAKGKFSIHGVERERIIKGTFRKKGNSILLQSTFTILLQEHDIQIPRIVYKKIAPEVTVKVNATLTLQGAGKKPKP